MEKLGQDTPRTAWGWNPQLQIYYGLGAICWEIELFCGR